MRHDGAVVGAALMGKPHGAWGLLDKELRTLAGYRDPARDKAEARRLLATAGYGPGKPLRVELVTRSFAIYSTWPRSSPTSSVRSAWRPRSSRSRPRSTFPC